jgi:threonine synthase
MGEGGTPLVTVRLGGSAAGDRAVYVKDESRNPTWSHKDRLNLCTVSAALYSAAPGIVVASSGNHGASAAAYASRAGLPCVLVTYDGASQAMAEFVRAYGAAVIVVGREDRLAVVNDIVRELGFESVSNRTPTHTGHPFGPEGYKTIAYELFLQLDRTVPGSVFVPTGYAELLFGIWKGYAELVELGVSSTVPRIYSAEPAARGPLHAAMAARLPATQVPAGTTIASSIACTASGYRGVVALNASHGAAVVVSDEQLTRALELLSRQGLWVEASGAAGLAALTQLFDAGVDVPEPVVAISTSGGLKNDPPGDAHVKRIPADWDSVRRELRRLGAV